MKATPEAYYALPFDGRDDLADLVILDAITAWVVVSFAELHGVDVVELYDRVSRRIEELRTREAN
jgi:hypothetical protein